jgi:hypothetical protein
MSVKVNNIDDIAFILALKKLRNIEGVLRILEANRSVTKNTLI